MNHVSQTFRNSLTGVPSFDCGYVENIQNIILNEGQSVTITMFNKHFPFFLEGAVVCNQLERPCGKSCSNIYTQDCYPSGLICFKFQLACEKVCYDPLIQHCYTGGIVCYTFQRLCGKVCYDPIIKTCRNAVVFNI